MEKATFIGPVDDMRGDARLYRLSKAVSFDENQWTEYVVVSGIADPVETYIFPADPTGRILHWGELAGSLNGYFDHERALRDAGYEVVGG